MISVNMKYFAAIKQWDFLNTWGNSWNAPICSWFLSDEPPITTSGLHENVNIGEWRENSWMTTSWPRANNLTEYICCDFALNFTQFHWLF